MPSDILLIWKEKVWYGNAGPSSELLQPHMTLLISRVNYSLIKPGLFFLLCDKDFFFHRQSKSAQILDMFLCLT